MLFMDELQPLRLYSGKRKVLIPFNEKDKRHGAAIFLMSSSQEQNEKMMNTPYIHNNRLYKAYYMDRNAMQYINSDAVNNAEEEFDELQEAVLSEGMFHTEKTKFVFENASTMDEKIIKKIYNKDSVDYACGMLGIKECPVDKFVVQFHSNLNDLRKSYPDFKNRTDDKQFYSFTDHKSTIHLLSYIVYDEKNMDGPYEMYARNELLYCIIVNEYPTINRKLANCVAMALSGQVEWLRDEKKKEEFKYMSDDKEHIDNLYLADLILQLYQTKGSRGIKKLLNGDVSVLSSIASGRIIRDTKKLFKKSLTEANLSSKERNELKDSDFGIPSKRKYPMPDAAHVKAAIRMFNHCDPEDEAELARHIKAKMKKYNVSADIGENNRLSKYIHESVIFSKEDTEIDLDKWKPGKKNILFVTGLSGGGKSTVAKKISAENQAMYIELDKLEAAYEFIDKDSYNRADEDLINEYHKKYGIKKDPRKMSDDEYNDYKNKCFRFMYNEMKKDKETLYVVEGIQVIGFAKEEFSNEIFNSPMIIKNTSMLVSMIRRLKRDGEFKIGDKKDVLNALKWYIDQEYSLSCLRKYAKSIKEDTAIITESVKSDFSDVKKVVDTLSDKELNQICNGDFKDSPYVKYRYIYRENDKPVGFIDVYDIEGKGNGCIVLAVDPEYRGNGISEKMVKTMEKNLPNSIKSLEWKARLDNKSSIYLAKKLGYKKRSVRDPHNVYFDKIITNQIHESDILQENWIFNSDDIYLNFDEWKPKKKNILYVTGLSGSGKSTLANELGSKYKAEVISLDLLVLSCFADKAKAARNQAKLSPTMKKYWDSEDHETILKWGDSAVTVEINHFLNWLNDNYYHSDDLYIVEGYELAAECPVKFLVNQPLIIKGTSTLTSILRRGKRSYLMKIDKGESVFDATVDGLKDIYRVIEGGRFIRNQLVLDQFKDLLNTVSNLNESAAVTDPSGINGLEYADDGYLFSGDYSEDYYAVLEITKDFTKEEYDRISFYPTYRESKYITKRIILRDPNEYPMCFMDVYHFPSDPERAQITTAVGKGFRGHGLCGEMLKKLLNSGFAEENGIKKYIWHVHPGNDASEHIASSNGFVKASDKLDKYGRMTYVYNVDQSAEANSITLPAISTESGVLMESGAIVYTEDLVDSKYDSKMKRYLYKERIKNKRDVTAIYDQVKQRNPIIQKTFRNVKLYNRLNVFVDTSYYHNLYLKNAFKNSKRSYYMYFDFLNRLMENEEIFKSYNKITYYFPVQFTRNGNTIDNLLDIKIDLNPLSLIIYFLKKDNEPLKRWANKEIVFLGDKGYFKVNFANFTIKNLQKFRKNVTRLLSKEEIGEDEDMDEFEPEDSPKAMAAETLDVIEKNTGVKIDDISGISSIKIKHLSMDTLTPKLIDEKSSNAIMILGTNSDAVISMISDKSLRSKDIQTYYKPKI